MTHFDRFDIAAAYWHFTHNICCQSGLHYDYKTVCRVRMKFLHQLDRLKYRPGLSDRRLSTISPNAKAIYMGLVRKHLGVKP